MGVPDHVMLWISSYIFNMQISEDCGQWCNIAKYASTTRSLQGSVLGPLLFLISIHSITSTPNSSDTQTSLYADDLLFYTIFQQDFSSVGYYGNWMVGLEQSPNFQHNEHINYTMLSRKRWALDYLIWYTYFWCTTPITRSMWRFPITPLHPLTLNGLHFNEVNILVYFSPLISPGPSHITPVCSKASIGTLIVDTLYAGVTLVLLWHCRMWWCMWF